MVSVAEKRKFEIIEWDRDYHVMVNRKTMEFDTPAAAEEWCRKESWTGIEYSAYELKSEPELDWGDYNPW